MPMNSNKISTNLNYYTIVRMRRIGMEVTAERIRGMTEVRERACARRKKSRGINYHHCRCVYWEK